LEDEVGVLGEELDSGEGGDAGLSCAPYFLPISDTNEGRRWGGNKHRITNGTAAINILNATAGNNPSINPSTIFGRSLIHPRKKIFEVKNWTLEMDPMIAAGIDQKITIAAMNP
jgi:hypothetical protein